MFNAGDVVEFVSPTEEERGDWFRVVEMRGDRVLVELGGWAGRIAPTFVYPVADLKRTEIPA